MTDPNLLIFAAERTYAINGTNGWHDGYTQADAFTKISLISTEVREWQLESRPGNEQQALNELADIIIRTMDTCELLERGAFTLALVMAGPCRHHPHHNNLLHMVTMYGLIEDAKQAFRKAPAGEAPANPTEAGPEVLKAVLPHLGGLALYALMLLEHYAARENLTAQDVITRVLDKNATRGYRHGGRRL
ncbi:hypothetical protein [Deinococcus sp. SL84]|uniref:hypothetical protein n=1 Tax=Deinococcus sp. SL84 TaxID=2994663 RepID=UPI002274F198|nr:hypothetical protein [Deinococcus sp. SL84]MCY1703670.1 hypothetical protein [Deinococcus sp. SL84]